MGDDARPRSTAAIAAAERAGVAAAGRLQPPLRRRLPGRARRGARRARSAPSQLLRSLTRDPGLANPGGGPAVDDLPADADPRLRHPAVAEPRRRAGRGLRHRRRAGRARVQGRRAAGHRRRRDHLRQRRPRGRRGELLRRLRLRRPRRGVRLGRAWSPSATAPAPRWCCAHATGLHGRDRPRRRRAAAATPTPGEFVEFADAVREGRAPSVTGDGRPAGARRGAGLHRVGPAGTRRSAVGAGDRPMAVTTGAFTLAVCAEMVFTDLPLPERVRRIDDARLPGGDLGLDHARPRRPGRHRGDVLLDDRLRRAATSPTPTAPTSCSPPPSSPSRSPPRSASRG